MESPTAIMRIGLAGATSAAAAKAIPTKSSDEAQKRVKKQFSVSESIRKKESGIRRAIFGENPESENSEGRSGISSLVLFVLFCGKDPLCKVFFEEGVAT